MAKHVVGLCMWRNDARRDLANRITHLLQKQGVDAWVWVVGDSDDSTPMVLQNAAARDRRVLVIEHNTFIHVSDPDSRLYRASQTINPALAAIGSGDTHVFLHESDLQTPPDIALRFLEHLARPEVGGIAGWPTLGEGGVFYDTYAYRQNGEKFTNDPPFHACYRPDALFEVESFGSCWMAKTGYVRGVQCERGGIIDICRQMRQRGARLWVDPQIPVVQPVHLWRSMSHASI